MFNLPMCPPIIIMSNLPMYPPVIIMYNLPMCPPIIIMCNIPMCPPIIFNNFYKKYSPTGLVLSFFFTHLRNSPDIEQFFATVCEARKFLYVFKKTFAPPWLPCKSPSPPLWLLWKSPLPPPKLTSKKCLPPPYDRPHVYDITIAWSLT